MAYTAIDDSEAYFQVGLYTGTGSLQAITLPGDTDMQPDLVWSKSRSNATSQNIADAVRGVTKVLEADATTAEATNANSLTAFGSDGFTVGTDAGWNGSSRTFVAWNWKANGSGSSNSDGSITATVSADTTSGFSIVSYTGTGSNASFGHGLGVMPTAVIIKRTDTTSSWVVMSGGSRDSAPYDFFGSYDYYLALNTTAAGSGALATGDNRTSTNSSSTYFNIGTDAVVNASSGTYIAYCFADISGYSKMGSYIGNGSADGTFVYTGFRPAFVMVKKTLYAAAWQIQDIKRNTYNPADTSLFANDTDADTTSSGYATDFLSNGFKLRGTTTARNESGENYIYMAFAEAPFVNSNGVPCNAR